MPQGTVAAPGTLGAAGVTNRRDVMDVTFSIISICCGAGPTGDLPPAPSADVSSTACPAS